MACASMEQSSLDTAKLQMGLDFAVLADSVMTMVIAIQPQAVTHFVRLNTGIMVIGIAVEAGVGKAYA